MEASWVEIASKLGIPVGLLILIGWGFVKYLWPFYTRQVESDKADRKADLEAARSDRKEEVAKFVETIRARDVLMADIQERNLKALEALTAKIEGSKTVRARRK